MIGLAIAQRLARDGRSVLVLERHEGIVRETSSHNSGGPPHRCPARRTARPRWQPR
ncbi:MAG: FAD-dependent oxidoreductase [Chloroflexota bacterium]